LHREYQPAQMAFGHTHPGDHDPRGHGQRPGEHSHADHRAELRWLIATTALVGLLLAADLVLAALGSPYRRPFGLSLALLAALIGGGRVVYLALSALLEGRIGADIALAIACVAAGYLGEYFVAAEVVFIALLGECLEAFTFERAQRAIQKLLEYRPRTARVIRDGEETEVEAELVEVGDLLVVRPGERIAADGLVTAGRSAVDQAVLTGESLPIDKGEGDPVYTGTVNQFGRLEVRAEKVGGETTLGQVIRLMAEAQARRSPLERAADRYARLFLPLVLSATVVVFLVTNLGGLGRWARAGESPSLDLMPALAVLVVACPCALVLATPAAVLATTARLARRGVLVKGGAALERLARVNTIAFDKTGTLTRGRPELGDRLVLHPDFNPDKLLNLAAAAERASEHPLARLVVAEAESKGASLPELEEFQAQPGAGIWARIREEGTSREVLVGNLRLFRERSISLSDEAQNAIRRLDESGQTVLLVAVDGTLVGALGARDRVRSEAHGVIHELEQLGLTDLAILTGDRLAPARLVARKLHLDQLEVEQTPADKAAWIQNKQNAGRVVAMVGDGINDAPALALADAGLALGGVGTDIAAEAGSVILMGDPLEPLPETFRMARLTVRVIRQNILIFAFGVNTVAVLLASLRWMGPVEGAIFHQVGSLLVLLNSLRLLGFERWKGSAPARGALQVAHLCRACRPSVLAHWLESHWRGAVKGVGIGLALAYLGSGITLIDSAQVGLVQRFGRYRPPLLEPGLHLRLPFPVETVTKVEPDQVRVARVGPSSRSIGPISWSAAHGAQREDSALFLTGDENLVELAGSVEYRYTRAGVANAQFQVLSTDSVVEAMAEGVFREVIGGTDLESVLVTRRRDLEQETARKLQDRLKGAGLVVAIDRVGIKDAHPPREVIPAYRDVSAAGSDAARFQNEAEGFAAERLWQAKADAQSLRDTAQTRSSQLQLSAEGDRQAFLARQSAYASQPTLTRFRLLWDAMATSFAGRPKVILDPRAQGRRQLWLADPDRLGLGQTLASPSSLESDEEPID